LQIDDEDSTWRKPRRGVIIIEKRMHIMIPARVPPRVQWNRMPATRAQRPQKTHVILNGTKWSKESQRLRVNSQLTNIIKLPFLITFN
jgi:hypothetical protein